MDYYQDSGHLFAKLFFERELPEFAKTAAYETSDTLTELPNEAFADPVTRSFPMHDRAHCFIGAAYCYAQPHDKQAQLCLPVLQKQAEFLGISDSLPELQHHVKNLMIKSQPKVAAWTGKTAAFRIPFGSHKIATLAGRGKEAALKAMDRFLELYREIPAENRQKVASDLLEAARDNGVETAPEDVRKFAGLAQHDPEIFKQQVHLRIGLVFDPLQKNAILSLLSDNPNGEVENLNTKVAKLIDIDQKHKLARFYGERLLDPHRSVFNDIPKQAAIIQVGPKRYPAGQWTGPTCDFHKGLEAAIGHEKAASFVSQDGQLDLSRFADLSDQEASLINRYLA